MSSESTERSRDLNLCFMCQTEIPHEDTVTTGKASFYNQYSEFNNDQSDKIVNNTIVNVYRQVMDN